MLPSVIAGLLIGPPSAPAKAPPDLVNALRSLEVTQGDGGATGEYQQGFRMVFGAERGRAAREDYPLLKSPLLKPGRRVVISVTVRATPRVLFDGIITRQELAGDDEPVVTVLGRDLSILMDLAQVGKRRPGQGDKEAALEILGRYSAYGISAKADSPTTSSPATEQQRVPIQTGSDLAHLRALAAQNGFIFYLKAGPAEKRSQACWGKQPRDAPEQLAISTRLGAGTNVEALSFSYDGLRPTQVVGAYADPDKAEPAPVQALARKGDKAFSTAEGLKADAEFVRKRRAFDTPFDTAQALARAQAQANRSAEQAISATGTLETNRYGDLLFAPGVVGVRGAGAGYDGLYYVASVTHTITPERYTQAFRLSREGTGSTTQKVKVR